jgi:hypothetical protein
MGNEFSASAIVTQQRRERLQNGCVVAQMPSTLPHCVIRCARAVSPQKKSCLAWQ